MKKLTFGSCLALIAATALSAQETKHFSFDVGAGFTTPVGTTGRNLDMGWNVGAGAGVNIIPYLGVKLDVAYNSTGINSSALNNLGYGGGNVNIFSATVDPVVHLNPKGHVDVYLTGGGGFYHQYQEFTQPSVAFGHGFNPWFGFYPYAVPVNVVVSSSSINKPGVDVGAGFAFGSKWHGKFFAEAKYNRIYTGNYHTDYVPVTFGFRW